MIVKAVVEMRLDRQRLVQELLEEVFLGRLTHEHALGCKDYKKPNDSIKNLHCAQCTILVVQRAISAAYHVQNVCNRYILVRVYFAVIELRIHYHYQVGSERQRKAHRLRRYYYLHRITLSC